MATRPLAELNTLEPHVLITREEIGVLAGLTRAEGSKHLTVNQWLHRYGPTGTSTPRFPETHIVGGGDFAAKHRIGEVRAWLIQTGRIKATPADGQAERYISRIEVCDLLDIRPETLKSWGWRGLFPKSDARQGRYARWKYATVEEWIEELADWVDDLADQPVAV